DQSRCSKQGHGFLLTRSALIQQPPSRVGLTISRQQLLSHELLGGASAGPRQRSAYCWVSSRRGCSSNSQTMKKNVRQGPRVKNRRPEVCIGARMTTVPPTRFRRCVKSKSSRIRRSLYPPSCRNTAARTKIP